MFSPLTTIMGGIWVGKRAFKTGSTTLRISPVEETSTSATSGSMGSGSTGMMTA